MVWGAGGQWWEGGHFLPYFYPPSHLLRHWNVTCLIILMFIILSLETQTPRAPCDCAERSLTWPRWCSLLSRANTTLIQPHGPQAYWDRFKGGEGLDVNVQLDKGQNLFPPFRIQVLPHGCMLAIWCIWKSASKGRWCHTQVPRLIPDSGGLRVCICHRCYLRWTLMALWSCPGGVHLIYFSMI